LKYIKYHMTHAEIARELGVSRATVQQIENSALWKLKKSGKLKAFLEAKEDYEPPRRNGAFTDLF
jgi:DNA-directed RNA polymerase sigma subunit (sigma70/sigma32)